MPKVKAITSLSGLIDSDIEDDSLHNRVEMMPTPDSNQENTEPPKKGRGKPRAAAAKVRKTKTASRRLSGGPATKTKAAAKKAKTRRAPLKEQINEARESDTEEVEAFQKNAPDGIESEAAVTIEKETGVVPQEKKAPRKRGKPGGKSKQTSDHVIEDAIEEPVKAGEKDGEFGYTPTTTRQTRGLTNAPALIETATGTQHQASPDPRLSERVIPETQPVSMDLDHSGFPEEEDEEVEALPQTVYKQSNHARAPSKQRQPPVVRKRTGSASDTERAGSDSAIRRRLGEMTKKFENLDLKYRNLREVGIKEAEVNFENLKKQSEERIKGIGSSPLRSSDLLNLYKLAANDLIASLKLELSTQRAQAQESRSLHTQLSSVNTSLAASQANNSNLTTSLTEAQNEIKTLQVKLSARAPSATAETGHAASMRTPGSALRGRIPGRGNMMGKEDGLKAEIAVLKEELYSDLTGLILRGVERGEESDVYDCIQTGRNGSTCSFPTFSFFNLISLSRSRTSSFCRLVLPRTNLPTALHFHLMIAHTLPPSATTPGPSSYDEIEFQYTPRLDESRDRELLELLPDFLTEEITFSRANAVKFYARVGEVMGKKRDVHADVAG